MLIKMAWRNIWRNKLRSILIALSIVMGIWAGMFIMSFSYGMYKEHIQNVVETQLSNIQIHHPLFQDDELPEYVIKNASVIFEKLKNDDRVKAVSIRNRTLGMISSATYSGGVKIVGVIEGHEKMLTSIFSSITKGSGFTKKKKNEIVIGEALAEKLHAKLKSKLILSFQNKSGDIVSASFQVIGFFKTKNSMFDESVVYTEFEELGALLGTGEGIHELAVFLKDDSYSSSIVNFLSNNYNGLLIQSWRQLAPELQLIFDSFNQYMYVFIAIILLTLMFGIINTMLMAVLERQHEFGILMAIGLNRIKIFLIVVLETVLLTLLGLPIGLLLTNVSVAYFHSQGIDLSFFSEGMARFGFSNIIHPELEAKYYFPISLMTAISALLSSIYPAYKALKLKPVEAIRKI